MFVLTNSLTYLTSSCKTLPQSVFCYSPFSSPGSCTAVERNNFKYKIWDHQSALPDCPKTPNILFCNSRLHLDLHKQSSKQTLQFWLEEIMLQGAKATLPLASISGILAGCWMLEAWTHWRRQAADTVYYLQKKTF